MTAPVDLFSLSGKVALVTGGAGILGQHFCLALAGRGAAVAVVDLAEDRAEAVAAEIRAAGGRAVGLACDVTDPVAVEGVVRRVVDEFDRIDILLNNAVTKGRNLDDFFTAYEAFTLEVWREIMAVNIDGMFLVSQAVGRRMVEQKSGSVIQSSSIYGILGVDKRIYEGSNYLGRQINTPAVYAASKAAVVGLTRYLAAYWADAGIRVNTVTFGGIESGQNETFKQRYGARVPLGRMGQPDELIGAILYLASDASSYVTGQNLVIDGGLSAW